MAQSGIVSDAPRVALGLIRLINGSAALIRPDLVAGQMSSAPPAPGIRYVLRMFGIRTVFLGLDLLGGNEDQRRSALQRAPIIHAVDASAAILAGLGRQLPARRAVLLVGISGLNLALALVARRAAVEAHAR